VWGLVAVLAAIAAGVAVYSYLSYLRSQIPVAGRLVPMVVAAHDIEPGIRVSPGDLDLIDHPERYLPDGALAEMEAVVGKVAAVPIFQGEPLTLRKLGEGSGLSSIVPEGMRAFSLPLTSGAGLGFLPEVGDRVDVIATLPAEVLGEPTSVTILRSREVAAVGGGAPGGGAIEGRLGLDGTTSGLHITLFVTPEESERLAMAETLGRITVVLAPSLIEEGPATSPVTPRDLTGR
jgi:pilus assembly protein CpaB